MPPSSWGRSSFSSASLCQNMVMTQHSIKTLWQDALVSSDAVACLTVGPVLEKPIQWVTVD